jgi:hypothetical protein
MGFPVSGIPHGRDRDPSFTSPFSHSSVSCAEAGREASPSALLLLLQQFGGRVDSESKAVLGENEARGLTSISADEQG